MNRTVSRIFRLLLCGSLLLLSSARGQGGVSDPTNTDRAETQSEVTLRGLTEVERARAIAFAQQLHLRTYKGEIAPLVAAIDHEGIVQSAIEGLGLSEKQTREFVTGLGRLLADEVFVELEPSLVGFLRLVEMADGPKLAFRSTDVDGNLEYWLFDFRVDGEAVRFVDYRRLSFPEPKIAMMRRAVKTSLAKQSSRHRRRHFGDEKNDSSFESHQRVLELAKAFHAGDWPAVATAYEGLDTELRTHVSTMPSAIFAYAELGDEAKLAKVVRRYRKHETDALPLDLILLGWRLFTGKYAEALAGVERLDAALGPDPYLDSYRAWIYKQQKKPHEALATALASVKALPEIEPTYWQLLDHALEVNDHEATDMALRNLRGFGYYFTWEEYLSDPDYEPFLESPLGRAFHAEEQERIAAEGEPSGDQQPK